MAELSFHVTSDWQEVVKLRVEISRLESQLMSIGSNADPMNIRRLESQLSSAKARFEELTAAAAVAASEIKDSMASVDMTAAIKQIRDFDSQIQGVIGSLDSYFAALRTKMQGALSSLQIGDVQIGDVQVPEANTSQVAELRRLYAELAEQIRQQTVEVEAQQQRWQQLAESIRTNNTAAVRQLTQEFAGIGKVEIGVSTGGDSGVQFDSLSAKIQKAKQDAEMLQQTVDGLWKLIQNGKTNITVGVQADFEKIQQLYDEISKLEGKVKNMDWGADPLHITELCNTIKAASEKIKSSVDELIRKTSSLGGSVAAIGAGHTQLRQLDSSLVNTRSGFNGLAQAAGVAAIAMERDGSNAAMALSNALGRVYGDAMMLTTTLLGGLGLEQLIVTVASTRSQFQQLEMSFNTMLGSADKAQALVTQLIDTAAKTPFDMMSITNGAKQLLAYGTQAEEVNDILVHLGDIAAGLSLPLGDLVYLYGTTMAQGRMYTMDLRQFMGRGIPMAEALAKQFGVSVNEVNKLVTEGKVGADVFKKAILDMSSEGGRFGGLMEKQAQTIGGRWSNIGDSVQQMFNEIGKASEGAIGAGLDIVSDLVENWRTVGKYILSAAAAFGTWKLATNASAGIQSMLQSSNSAQQLAALDAEIAKMRELIQQRQGDAKATLEQQVATGQLTQAQAEEIARRQQLLNEMRQQAGMRTAEEEAQIASANAENIRNLEEQLSFGKQLVGLYQQEYDEKAKGLAQAEEVKRKADERVQSALEYLDAEKEIAATQGSALSDVNEAQADYEAALAEQVAAAKELKAAQEEADAAATNLNSMAEEVNTLQEELNTAATGANSAATTANTAAENVNSAATTRNTATVTGNTVSLKLHAAGTKLAAAGQKILTSAVNFTEAAFQRLKLAIVTNPIGAVLTAISAAIPFFLDFGDATESAAQASERFGKAAADEIDNANVLISTLQNIEKQSNVYKQAQDELNKILAQYNIGLIDEKTTTEELIKKKNELIAAINKEAEARTKANAIDTIRNDYKEKEKQWEDDLLEGLKEAEHIDRLGFAYWDSDEIQEHAEGFRRAMVAAINRELPNIVELEGDARNQAVTKLREQLATILTDAGVSEYDASFLKGSMNWDGSWNDVLYESINAAIELREQFKENTDIVENFWNKTEEKATKVNLTLAQEYGNTAEEAKKLFDDFQVEQWGLSLMDATANADVLSRALPNIVPSDLDPDKAFDKLLLLEEACKKKIDEITGQKYHVAVDYATLYGLRNMLATIQKQMSTVFSDFNGGDINLNTTNGMNDRIKEINKLMGEIDISTTEGREKYAAYKKERDRIQKMLDDTTGKKNGSTGRKYDPKAAEYNRRRLMQDYQNDMVEFERDMQNNLTNARIQNMAEGTERELAQLQQDALREQQALDERMRKLVEKRKKLDEQLWLNGGKDRKISDYRQTKTDEQYLAEVRAEIARDASGNVITDANGNPVTVGSLYDAQVVENDIRYQKQRADILKAEDEAMREYLKEYGTYEERKKAITDEYEEKIAQAKTEGEKLILQKQMEEELERLEERFGKAKQFMIDLFGDVSKKSVAEIGKIIRKYEELEKFLSGDGTVSREKLITLGFTDAEIDEALNKLSTGKITVKEFTDALKEMKGELADRSPWQKFKKNIEDAVEMMKKSTGDRSQIGTAISNIGSACAEYLPEVERFAEGIYNIFGIDDSGAKSAISAMKGLSIATQGIGQIMSGDYITGITNTIDGVSQAISSIGDIIDDIGRRRDLDAENNKAELSAIRESVDKIVEKFDNDTMAQAIEDYETALKRYNESLLKAQENVQNAFSKSSSNIAGRYNHHSINYYMNDYGGQAEFDKINALLGTDVKGWGDLWFLSPDQLEKIQRELPQIFSIIEKGINKMSENASASSDDENARAALEAYMELAGKLQEVNDAFNLKMTGTTADSVKSDFKNMLSDMKSEAKDFCDDFEDMIADSVINSMMADKYNKELENWYKMFSDAYSNGDGIDTDELTNLRNEYDRITNEAIKERDNLLKTLGIDTEDVASQEADKKGFAAMSQDTGEELNGRFTALQIAGENISAQMNVGIPILTAISGNTDAMKDMVDGIGQLADDMLANIVECYTELNLIRTTTDEMLPIMKSNKAMLEKIEKNTKSL